MYKDIYLVRSLNRTSSSSLSLSLSLATISPSRRFTSIFLLASVAFTVLAWRRCFFIRLFYQWDFWPFVLPLALALCSRDALRSVDTLKGIEYSCSKVSASPPTPIVSVRSEILLRRWKDWYQFCRGIVSTSSLYSAGTLILLSHWNRFRLGGLHNIPEWRLKRGSSIFYGLWRCVRVSLLLMAVSECKLGDKSVKGYSVLRWTL